jgi:hypothetical protein
MILADEKNGLCLVYALSGSFLLAGPILGSLAG